MLQHALAYAVQLREQLDFVKRLHLALSLVCLSALLLKTLVAGRPAGPQRVALVLPIVALNFWIPLLFDAQSELVMRTSCTFMWMWLASFKALALALNRGPLASAGWSLAQHTALYVLPVYPKDTTGLRRKGRLGDSAGSWSFLLMRFFGSAALLAVVVYLLVYVPLPWMVKMYVYAFGLYAFVTTLMNGPGAIVQLLLSVELAPHFDQPWLMSSLADFWAHRWNNSTGLVLRSLIYDPIMERAWVHHQGNAEGSAGAAKDGAATAAGKVAAAAAAPSDAATSSDSSSNSDAAVGVANGNGALAGSGAKGGRKAAAGSSSGGSSRAGDGGGGGSKLWRQLLASSATFAASGIMHELILAYDIDTKPGHWFMFFAIQAPLSIAELLALKALRRRGITLPRLVRMAIPTGLLFITAHYFFFPPVMEPPVRLADQVVAAIRRNIEGGAAALTETATRAGWGAA